LAKPVVLVGHSLGATVVELAALAVGDRVRGLILVCPAPWAGAHHSVEGAEYFSSFAGNEQEILAVRKREVVTMPREGVLEGLSASAARIRPEVIRDLVAVWNEGLAWPSTISDYTGPTFILSGSGDTAITSEMFNNGVIPRFPAATTFALEASSHWPHIEEPAATATQLARFLESLPLQ
jgi:esterase